MFKLSQLKPNPKNPRFIRDAKFEKLKKSLEEFPAMMELRPMVIDEDNIVLGGNMRLKALKELKYKEIPDGWVKKATELTEDEKRRFVITDNVGFGEWDWDILANEWDAVELDGWGVDVPSIDIADMDLYTRKIVAPTYKITTDKPEIGSLYNSDKPNTLIKEINQATITESEKEFLRAAASRHIIFNYSHIAEYYAHSPKEVQLLMEKSGLVIIDFNKAIENGYINLSNDIIEQYAEEYEQG